MICDDNISVRTIAESVTVSADFNQVFDEISQFIRLRLFEAWAKRIIIIRCFHTFLAPFTSVIDTRDARHTEEKSVSKRKMILIRQDACDTCDIVIVYKCHQMLSTINAPLFRSKLTVQGMCDLEHVHTVEAGENSFVALVICTAVKHLVIYDQVVVTEENFTDQRKSRFQFLTEAAQTTHEIMIQTISYIQTQSVYAELFNPHLDTVKQIVDNCRILQI